MHRILFFAALILGGAMLGACSPGINGIGQRITFDSAGMVVHATGHPDAHVDRDGELRIAGKPVATTPGQRELLQHYYQQARAMMESGKVVGKQGAALGLHAIGDAFASFVHGGTTVADRQLDAQSRKIEDAALALCADARALGTTQKAIAAAIPAFAPYQSGFDVHCDVHHRPGGPRGSVTVSPASARPAPPGRHAFSGAPAPGAAVVAMDSGGPRP